MGHNLSLAILVILISISTAAARNAVRPVAPSSAPQAAYPAWAHDHWVWLHNSVSNRTNVEAMVKGYLSRGIKVGAVDIDSDWSTGINNFVWDNNKFPNAAQLIQNLHAQNIRVILWTTSMVNTDSPNYKFGYDHNYYLNSGATIKWWHGHGSFIDYTNPDGLEWWHSQLDNVIKMGIDGWKCDGTDPFVFELIIPRGYAGIITERQYANSYYRDFFNYTRKTNPDALIMSRPVDSYGDLYWEFSPRDVVFSGWVGDQDDTFAGLQNALDNIFESAWANYVNFGSDIGGYRTPQTRTKSLFLRWAQFGAFMPLMENGGGGNHFPWLFDNETTTIYKNFVDIHYQLQPYLLNAGSTAYSTGVSVITPLANSVIIWHRWDYLLWTDIYVAPIVEDSLNRQVTFPDGNSWIYWFDNSRVYAGGSTANLTVPLSEFPAFHRKGAILPLHVDTDSQFGDSDAKGYLSVVIHPLASHQESTTVRRWRDISTDLHYSMSESGFEFTATGSDQGVILVLNHVVKCPPKVFSVVHQEAMPSLESKAMLNEAKWGFYCNPEKSQLFVHFGENNRDGAQILIPELQIF